MLFLNRITELEHRLLKELSSILPKYGFSAKYRGQTFYMPKPFGWAAFHLAFIPHRDVDFDLTADIALRVDAVQEIVNQDERLPKKEKLETATLGCELGNLSEGRQRRWKIASKRDVEPVAKALETALVNVALPYFEQYSNLETMFSMLCRNDKEAWLHSPLHHYRGMSALAMAIVLGRNDQVEHIIVATEEFMKSINDPNLRIFRPFANRIRAMRDKI